MSDYSLVQRGTIHVTNADGASPKKVNVGSPIKLSSSILVARIEDGRRNPRINEVSQTISSTEEPAPHDFSHGVAIDDHLRTEVHVSHYRDGSGAHSGLSYRLPGTSAIRFEWRDGLSTDTIETVIQFIEHRLLTVNAVLINESGQDKIQISWTDNSGTPTSAIASDEQIDVTYEIWDIENLGDDIKELLFRGQLILGHLLENVVQDGIVVDTAGNMVAWRRRVFSTKANAEAAERDVPDGDALATGELVRVKFTQTINFQNNEREELQAVVLAKASTPGVN
jgi:hypothetical protein